MEKIPLDFALGFADEAVGAKRGERPEEASALALISIAYSLCALVERLDAITETLPNDRKAIRTLPKK